MPSEKKLLFILLGSLSLNVHAVHPTQGPLQQHPALCNYGYNPNCNHGSASTKKIIETTIVHRASKYGALANDRKTGSISGALNANSLAEAKKAAIRQCSQGGKNKDCKVITWVRNGCIAAASGKLRGKFIIYKAAEKPGQAESVAMSRCKAAGVSGCRIIVPEGCSVPEGMYN
ncbi:DUF4189 domain-containing protein [Neisseria sp.]|uniref:DUF4189 domain-containing protein n=2 Tax=Neisseria sp. TaxID=192066 RepID=UPI00359FDACA